MKLSEMFSFRQMAINEILKNIAAEGSPSRYATSLILADRDHHESVIGTIKSYLADDPDPRVKEALEQVLKFAG